tara:strand:- start:18034 stop:19239 length:1206 start_codon:yes stop_codon:yes gene_type:complete
MSHKPTITDSLQFSADSKLPTYLFGAGLAGLILSAIGYFTNTDQFFFSYLVSFTFFTGIAVASVFMVLFHHITKSKWGVVFRRIPETIGANLWIWTIFVLPVILGIHNLYHWSHEDAVATDHILQAKSAYLNTPFFIVRQFIYFAIWGFVGRKLYKASVDLEKTGDWGITSLMRKISAPAIPLFAFSLTFAGFDWLMSLDPHWFSTMFGVYYFAISFQAFWAVMILMAYFLHSQGYLKNTIVQAHIYDLGAWLFAFTVFYAYIAFSQFLLIYYANLPEETLWFYDRLEGGFQYIAYGMLLFRFALPFLVLLNREQKHRKNVLIFVAVVVVVMHFLELYWIAMPTMHPEEAHGLHFSWMDLTTFIGLGGIFFGLFFRQFKKNSMIPENDPKLDACLEKTYHH